MLTIRIGYDTNWIVNIVDHIIVVVEQTSIMLNGTKRFASVKKCNERCSLVLTSFRL